MSGFTRLTMLQDLLGQRDTNITKLAAEIGAGRSHLSQVLNGHRTGGITRVALYKKLTTLEIACLGWGDDYLAWCGTEAGKKFLDSQRKDLQSSTENVPMAAQQ